MTFYHTYVDVFLAMNNRTKESPFVNYRIQHMYQATIPKRLQTKTLYVSFSPICDILLTDSKKGSFATAGNSTSKPWVCHIQSWIPCSVPFISVLSSPISVLYN